MKITVCLIAKNETDYFVEWLAYYRLLGFDKIIVYDNRSNQEFRNMLRKFARANLIVHRVWDKGLTEAPQISAYRHAIKNETNDWILFVDCDEFLVLKNSKNINEIIAPLHARTEISLVGINWKMFGDSGLETKDSRPLIEKFTKCAAPEFPANFHIKSFHRVSMMSSKIHMHACETKGQMVHASGKELFMSDKWGVSQTQEFEVAQINHYYTKTYEEYLFKTLRGHPASRDFHPSKYHYDRQVFDINNRNDTEDMSIQPRLDEVKVEIARLNAMLN